MCVFSIFACECPGLSGLPHLSVPTCPQIENSAIHRPAAPRDLTEVDKDQSRVASNATGSYIQPVNLMSFCCSSPFSRRHENHPGIVTYLAYSILRYDYTAPRINSVRFTIVPNRRFGVCLFLYACRPCVLDGCL